MNQVQCTSHQKMSTLVRLGIGSILNISKSEQPRSSRIGENVTSVRYFVRESTDLSVRKQASAFNVFSSSLLRILRKDLYLHLYKLHLVQKIKPNVASQIFQFFTNVTETHCHLTTFGFRMRHIFTSMTSINITVVTGALKFQNASIRNFSIHQKMTIWALMSARGIIGSYFFEYESGHAVTMNSDRYVEMLDNFLVPVNAKFCWLQSTNMI